MLYMNKQTQVRKKKKNNWNYVNIEKGKSETFWVDQKKNVKQEERN